MSDDIYVRQSAVRILGRVLSEKKTVDFSIAYEKDYETYQSSDRHFIKLVVLTVLRRLGQIDGVIKKVLKKPLSKKQEAVQNILRISVAQKLFLNTPSYAVVNTAVELAKKFKFQGLSGLVNGVLRNIIRMPNPLENLENPSLNIPDWLYRSWQEEYQNADDISAVFLKEPPLDITVAKQPEVWAQKWNGIVLPTGSVRVNVSNPEDLEGFKEGRVWVQNASASVPAQLLSQVEGKHIADLCAAPGGKTAQLAFRKAEVTAIDISRKRLKRMKENMIRLGVSKQVEILEADALSLDVSKPFDAVLLDAPCSATGTIARHPEIKYQKTLQDVQRLAELQKKLLAQAIRLTKKGGEIVFSTCSLQPEEGDRVVQSMSGQVEVIRPKDTRWKPFLTPFGSLRFLPTDGFDGFYACLMKKL